MSRLDRLTIEQQFHDRQAAERAATFRMGRADLSFADEAFLDHETWIRPAFNQLGSLRSKQALDYGCGHGMAAVVMARAGASVSAFDLSPGYVDEARERALANRVEVKCAVASGESLPYPDATFDAVWGNAILHHLDLPRASQELYRVMRPGAVAVFCEPWGGNPLLSFARRWLPYPGKHRTTDERPLASRDLAPLKAVFGAVELEGFQFFGMLHRLGARPRLTGWLNRIDSRLLRFCPRSRNWCRYMVITLRKATP